MNHEHSNPIISIFSGFIFGLIAFVSEHGFLIDNFYEFLKVVSFGFVGGAMGYVGRETIRIIHKKIKS